MAHLANLKGVSETLPVILKLPSVERMQRRAKIIGFLGIKKEEIEEHSLQTTRRVAVGLASVVIFWNSCIGVSLAEDNGLWLTGPLPEPTVSNKIANEKTGTRSFLKKGLYMANIGVKGSLLRLRKYAFDLLALGDLIGPDTWNYVRKYLRLKSTFMYYDFDKVISAASINDKQPLIDLAIRLFDSVEELEDAVKLQNLPKTESCYEATTAILREVRDRME